MELSIVTTMYHSAPYLLEFYTRCCAAAEKITLDFEIILVNDGSPDESLELALQLFKKDSRIRVIDLSRNFGQHKALMTGLSHARGHLVFLIDCDLEIGPEVLVSFHERLVSTGADVVFGVQDTRHDPLLDRLLGSFFYRVFNWLSDVELPKNLTTARLMTQRYVSALGAHRERELEIGGLWVITGFRQEPVTVTKIYKGQTTYDLARKVALTVNAVTSFSDKPLVMIFYAGSAISGVAGLAIAYIVIHDIFLGRYSMGWPSLIVSIWLVGGLVVFCLGIVGIYLSRVYIETKQRPYTIIREKYERPEDEREH
jgi:putative glycosyltransferase